MNREDFYRLHTIFYFLYAFIGFVFCHVGRLHPVYNEATGEILKPYSMPFIVIGIVFIVFAFIGLLFFVDTNEEK